MFSTLLFSMRVHVNMWLFTQPRIFFPYMSRRPRYRDFVINGNTEIVIEGFPRSANTFAYAAFQIAQGRDTVIAHHTHAPAQVILASKFGLPTVVLIRNPEDATASLILREPRFSPIDACRLYAWYYTAVMRYRDKFVLADFDTVTTDFGEVINAVNRKFSTSFHTFRHSDENLEAAFDLIEELERADSGHMSEMRVARPSTFRKSNSQRIRERIIREASNELSVCRAIYCELAIETQTASQLPKTRQA